MLSFQLAVAALIGTTFGLPSAIATEDPTPVRILPEWWEFNITALKGPGCPDFGAVNTEVTRPTYGRNTVDGSEIYYWYYAYPHIHASVDATAPEASIWCETTLSYAEQNQDGTPATKPGYRLKAHKNGTDMLAIYNLDKGVEATWKFTYYPEGKDPIVDTIKVDGPRSSDDIDEDNSPVGVPIQWALPECGTGTIKYRTELTVKATEKGAKGTVSSELVTYNGETDYYGIQQGVSYDFEKCDA